MVNEYHLHSSIKTHHHGLSPVIETRQSLAMIGLPLGETEESSILVV